MKSTGSFELNQQSSFCNKVEQVVKVNGRKWRRLRTIFKQVSKSKAVIDDALFETDSAIVKQLEHSSEKSDLIFRSYYFKQLNRGFIVAVKQGRPSVRYRLFRNAK